MRYPSPEDIAEIKAGGYDSSTIAEAEGQAKRWVEAQRVAGMIEAAFAGVTLGKGVGLLEGGGLDDYADAATRETYRASDEKDDWRRITPEALQACRSSLSFFDAEGMRFHLPAYLLVDLLGDESYGMAFCLTHLTEDNIGRFALFSPQQRAAVRAYLLHILDERAYEFDRPDIERALASFWTNAASTEPGCIV